MSPRLRRPRNIVLVLLGVVAAYGVLGAFVAPPIAKKVLVGRLEERLGRHVELDGLFANPYTLQVRAKGFRVMEPDGKTVFASLEALDLDGSTASFLHFAPVFDEARLQAPRLRFVRTDATHYSFDDIVARLAAAAKAAKARGREEEPARFSVSNIVISGGAIDFDDVPAHARHRVTEVSLAIPFISNLPTHRRDRVQPAFSATVNGAPLHLTGEAQPFEDTVRTNFTLDVHDVDVPRYLGYLPADFPVKLDSGKLDAKVALRFTQAPGREPTIDLAGTAALAGVAVSTPEGALARVAKLEADIASADPLGGRIKLAALRVADADAMKGEWRIATAAARDIDVDLHTHAVRVGALEASGGKLGILRRADGSIDVPHLPPSEHPVAWKVALGQLALTGYAVALQDQSVKPAATHRFTVASVQGRDLTTERGGSGQAAVKVRLDRGGSLDADATFALEPLEVKATVDGRAIDLVPVRHYFVQFPAIDVKSALASAAGTVGLQGKPGGVRVTYDGNAQVERLATWDTINKEDLLNWKRVKASGLKLDVAPGAPIRLSITDVDVQDAYSRIFVNPEGKLNVQQLMGAPAPGQPAPPPSSEPPRARDIRIDRIRFAGSRLNFTDHYIRPNYTADVGDVKGAVTGLSSDPASRATVMLAGRWDASSPVVIAGTVNPLSGNLFLDIGAQGEAIDLTKLTAYSQRYAGYGIKGGRLTLDVKYHVEDGKMQGRNRILVDQLVFGDKVESPDATKLPVLFLVSLLKDKDGRINLELPVSGSLDDPKFEIGAVIGQMFSSHFTKAATSPFSLLGGAEGDLGYVDFEAGDAKLTPAAQAKLDALVKVLQDRPGLKLEIEPAVATPRDLEVMKAAALEKRLAAAPKDLSKEAREALAKQPVEIGDAERAALASGRVEQVKAYLAGESRLPAERVVVGSEAPQDKAPQDKAPAAAAASRVVFALR